MRLNKMAARPVAQILMASALALLSACATRPPVNDPVALSAYQRANDPYEATNRKIFKFNQGFDHVVMRPIAVSYRAVLPEAFRRMITNFLHNIGTPFILANDILQGQGERGATTFMRFITNTTIGLGGIMDPATKMGYERHAADLGQTLGVWGVGEGVYLVLPFIGPSNPRDAFGLAGEFLGDPTSLYIKHEYGREWSWFRTGMDILDYRTANIKMLDELEANSSDFYTAMRSAYRQNRAYRINYGKPPAETGKDDPFATEMEEPDAAPAP